MITFFQKSYGGFPYAGGSDFGTWEETIGYRQRISKAMQRDGAFSAGALHDPRRVSIKGILQPAGGALDQASFRSARDAFAAAHAAGAARPLQLDSDRYLNAEVEMLTIGEWNGLPNVPVVVSFLCYDVYWYSAAFSFATLPAGGGTTAVATGGTATALPIFSFSVSAAPAGGLITLNNAAGDSCSFSPSAPGVYLLDAGQESLTLAGADAMPSFSGVFPLLAAGSDQVTLTLAGGVTLSAATAGWQSRFY